MTKYLNFLFIGMFGHEVREEKVREDKEKNKEKKEDKKSSNLLHQVT